MSFRICGRVPHYFFSIPAALEMRQGADRVEAGNASVGGDHCAGDWFFDAISEEAIDGAAPDVRIAINALAEREGDAEDDRD